MRSLVIIFLFTATLASAQQINYKVIADEPRKINNLSINIDLAAMDFGIGNIDGASFNLGVWGHAMYKQRMGIDYSYRYGWLTLGKFASPVIKSHLNFQTGGFFIFHKRTASTTNKVVLKTSSGYQGGKNVTITEFLMVPSQKFRYQALRGGIYFDRSGARIENPTGADSFTNFYILGAYGGLCFGSTRHIIIQTDKYGEKGVVSHVRFCLDAIITPISNAPTSLKNQIPIGARLLCQALPTLRRRDKGKKAYRTKMTAEFEVGYRMIAGLYLGGSLSIPISRSIKAMQSEGETLEMKRTAE
ncbi:MAG: hypothetical protein K0S32_4087 [Bacteroidetes bacterium]|jgi:hypothetical protein|nr:hypothetical protein [Bacteroidota bacterium]